MKVNKTYNITELLSGADPEGTAARIIDLYVSGPVSDSVKELFREWLTSDISAENKEAALQEFWDSCEAKFDSETVKALQKVKALLSFDSLQIAPKPKAARRSPFAWVGRIAAVVVPLMAVAGAYLWFSVESPSPVVKEYAHHTITAYAGETRHVLLPDSSQVWLQGGSTISYSEDFSTARKVSLNGEAYFSVERDERLFLVDTKYVDVKVLGTKFNISAHEEEQAVSVLLESGSIEAILGNDVVRMEPGEYVSYDKTTGEFTKRRKWNTPSGTSRADALILDYMTLGSIFRSCERYFGVTIVVDNPAKAESGQFTTRFERDDKIEDVMFVLKSLTQKFDYKIAGDGEIKIKML